MYVLLPMSNQLVSSPCILLCTSFNRVQLSLHSYSFCFQIVDHIKRPLKLVNGNSFFEVSLFARVHLEMIRGKFSLQHHVICNMETKLAR